MGFIAPPTRRSAADAKPLSKVCWRAFYLHPLGEGTDEGVFISFDAIAARLHARLSAELAAKGTAVGPHDLIIAATVLAKGLSSPPATNAAFRESRDWRINAGDRRNRAGAA
jgi:hypothetical protein